MAARRRAGFIGAAQIGLPLAVLLLFVTTNSTAIGTAGSASDLLPDDARLLVAVPSPTFSNDQTIFVNSLLEARAWRSRTGGMTWSQVFRYADPYRESSSLSLSPALTGNVGPTVYLLFGFHIDPMEFRLVRSLDGGVTWQERALMCGGFGGGCAGLETTSDPNTVFQPGIYSWPYMISDLGVKRSVNGGLSWRRVWDDAGVAQVVASPSFSEDQTVFASPQMHSVPYLVPKLIVSFNGGEMWQSRDLGLCDRAIDSIAISPSFAQDQTLFVSQGNTIWQSHDAGATWQVAFISSQVPCQDPDTTSMHLFLSPDWPNDHVVYADWDGLFVSYDDARSWQRLTRADYPSVYIRHRPVVSVAGEPYEAGHWSRPDAKSLDVPRSGQTHEIYVPSILARGPRPMPLSVFISGTESMWRSDDGGVTWQRLPPPTEALAYLPLVRARSWSPFENSGIAGE